MNILISLNFSEENEWHKDLYLNIPTIDVEEILDTYYFLIDKSFMPNLENKQKVILSLTDNFKYWILRTEALNKGETVAFPIDLSDEYIGFLLINALDENVLSVRYGSTQEITGWQINAHNPEQFDLKYLNDTDISDSELIITKEDFINDIKRNINNLHAAQSL
ncbi:hypothetical protein [Chryseobacterium oryctis]|uniref:Uncharacterized protein n=1 Tax=Chryseobacterium oryctis TaxID=2952618 RepID=A0ABT3HLF3_9FLAO|nr:hypothetical protein [Chryseobacterium oryctis]MCW3160623.1 hypothetical protein [Chryseobacterium oryctis]